MTKDGTVHGRRSERPTGIIRTLPSLYGQRSTFGASINASGVSGMAFSADSQRLRAMFSAAVSK